MRKNDTLKRLAVITLMAAVVLLAASDADAQRYDLASFHRHSGNSSSSTAPKPKPSTPSDPLGTAGSVAGHGGTGEMITKLTDHAQDSANSAAAQTLSNTQMRNRLRAQGHAGKLGTKGGHLQRARADLIKKAPGAKNLSRWTRIGKWLGRLGAAIDIVSPASRIAGHLCEGDWSGARWAAADEATKKLATTKGAALGAAGGTAVGGPVGGVVGGVVGAAAAEELHSHTAGALYDSAAQASKDQETWDRLAGPRMRDRHIQGGGRTRVRTHVPTSGSRPRPPTTIRRTGCRCGRGR